MPENWSFLVFHFFEVTCAFGKIWVAYLLAQLKKMWDAFIMVSPMISDKLFSWFLGGASRVSSSQAVIAPWGVVFGRKTKLKWTYHSRKFQRGSLHYLLCEKSWSCKPLSDIFRTSLPRFSAICILIVQNAIHTWASSKSPGEGVQFFSAGEARGSLQNFLEFHRIIQINKNIEKIGHLLL